MPGLLKLLEHGTNLILIMKDMLKDMYIHPGGALGYFLGGYVPPGTPNWHPVLEKISPKIDTPF